MNDNDTKNEYYYICIFVILLVLTIFFIGENNQPQKVTIIQSPKGEANVTTTK
jgi:hypothetical protein